MELYKYFKEDYELLDLNNCSEYEVVDEFLENSVESKERKYCEPLKAVFIHKTRNEMFLVLDCLKLNLESIKKVCDEWERKVLNFVNFGSEYRENIGFLKYNIFLVILNSTSNVNDDFRFEMEKSIKICRKIFLLSDENGEINEADKEIIPFYFATVESIDNSKTEKLEKELEDLLPKDVEIQSICMKEKLELEDIKKMCRWLSENDNN